MEFELETWHVLVFAIVLVVVGLVVALAVDMAEELDVTLGELVASAVE